MTIAKLQGIQPTIGSSIKSTAIDLVSSVGNASQVVTRNIATLKHLSTVAEANAQELAISARGELLDTYASTSTALQNKHSLSADEVRLWLLG